MLANTKNIENNLLGTNIDNFFDILAQVADNVIKEELMQKTINAINVLGNIGGYRAVEILMPLVTFWKEVDCYINIDGFRSFVGRKEIGAPIRLAAVKALGKLGNTKALPVLTKALNDRGDMDKETGEVRWFVYNSGDEIRKEASNSISKLQQELLAAA